jgi:hypothetical protein
VSSSYVILSIFSVGIGGVSLQKLYWSFFCKFWVGFNAFRRIFWEGLIWLFKNKDFENYCMSFSLFLNMLFFFGGSAIIFFFLKKKI